MTPPPQPLPAEAIPLDVEMMRESVARARGVLSPARILPADMDLGHQEGLLRGHIALLADRLDEGADTDGPVWPRVRVAVVSARVALDDTVDATGLHAAVRVRMLGDACEVLLDLCTEGEAGR
jgi:hypothetical protein